MYVSSLGTCPGTAGQCECMKGVRGSDGSTGLGGCFQYDKRAQKHVRDEDAHILQTFGPASRWTANAVTSPSSFALLRSCDRANTETWPWLSAVTTSSLRQKNDTRNMGYERG